MKLLLSALCLVLAGVTWPFAALISLAVGFFHEPHEAIPSPSQFYRWYHKQFVQMGVKIKAWVKEGLR